MLRIIGFGGAGSYDHQSYSPYGLTKSAGNGLTDTTAWNGTDFTGGAGDFCMRMQPTNSTNLFTWDVYSGNGKLVGNQQTKTIHIDCRIKINNFAYYAGVHTNPTLRVVYDGGTTTSAVATNTTNAQQLVVSFTPTTTNPRIDVYIDGATDAAGSNAYIYVGEINIGLPDSTSIDNTRLTYWSNALPLPPDATIPTPVSFLSVLEATLTGAGTFGKAMADFLAAYTAAPTVGAIDTQLSGVHGVGSWGGGGTAPTVEDIDSRLTNFHGAGLWSGGGGGGGYSKPAPANGEVTWNTLLSKLDKEDSVGKWLVETLQKIDGYTDFAAKKTYDIDAHLSATMKSNEFVKPPTVRENAVAINAILEGKFKEVESKIENQSKIIVEAIPQKVEIPDHNKALEKISVGIDKLIKLTANQSTLTLEQVQGALSNLDAPVSKTLTMALFIALQEDQ